MDLTGLLQVVFRLNIITKAVWVTHSEIYLYNSEHLKNVLKNSMSMN